MSLILAEKMSACGHSGQLNQGVHHGNTEDAEVFHIRRWALDAFFFPSLFLAETRFENKFNSVRSEFPW